MDYDKNELMSAMYQIDDETPPKPDVQIDPFGFQRSRKLRVGAVEYEVPTVEYVSRLEQLIMGQAQIIERQRNEITRLDSFMTSTRNFIRRQTARIAEMQNGLDNKLDVRESL